MFKIHKHVKITSRMIITFITKTVSKHTIHLQLQGDDMYLFLVRQSWSEIQSFYRNYFVADMQIWRLILLNCWFCTYLLSGKRITMSSTEQT